jgi:hypothetical protein
MTANFEGAELTGSNALDGDTVVVQLSLEPVDPNATICWPTAPSRELDYNPAWFIANETSSEIASLPGLAREKAPVGADDRAVSVQTLGPVEKAIWEMISGPAESPTQYITWLRRLSGENGNSNPSEND